MFTYRQWLKKKMCIFRRKYKVLHKVHGEVELKDKYILLCRFKKFWFFHMFPLNFLKIRHMLGFQNHFALKFYSYIFHEHF